MVEIELHDGIEPVLFRYRTGNWEICWKKNEKNKDTGEIAEVWEAQKWYANPAAALNALALLRVGHSNVKTLKELKAAIEQVHTEITKEYQFKVSL